MKPSDDEFVEPGLHHPHQTSDWCICILCSKIIGLADIKHMHDEFHIARMQKDTSGVAKYIFNIPRPLYRDTLRQYPDDYMPSVEELNASYEYYHSHQPFMHGATIRPTAFNPPVGIGRDIPQYRFNTTTLQHEVISNIGQAVHGGVVGSASAFHGIRSPSPQFNEELDRQIMELAIKESIEEQKKQQQNASNAVITKEQGEIQAFYKSKVIPLPEDNIGSLHDEWTLMEDIDDMDNHDSARESLSDDESL